MFPLRVGVIGSCLASRLFPPCVSPAWGLSACPQSGVSSPLVFPRLTGVIWGMWLSTERTESSFPCAGLSVPQFLTDYLKNVFPLRGGYWRIRGAILPGPCVFPLRAGVNGLLRAYHRYCLILPEFGGCRAIEREPIFTVLVFSLLRGVNDVVGEGICHQ